MAKQSFLLSIKSRARVGEVEESSFGVDSRPLQKSMPSPSEIDRGSECECENKMGDC
jgi:hypothetical protein